MECVRHVLGSNQSWLTDFNSTTYPAGATIPANVLCRMAATRSLFNTTLDLSRTGNIRSGLNEGKRVKVLSGIPGNTFGVVSIYHVSQAPGSVACIPTVLKPYIPAQKIMGFFAAGVVATSVVVWTLGYFGSREVGATGSALKDAGGDAGAVAVAGGDVNATFRQEQAPKPSFIENITKWEIPVGSLGDE